MATIVRRPVLWLAYAACLTLVAVLLTGCTVPDISGQLQLPFRELGRQIIDIALALRPIVIALVAFYWVMYVFFFFFTPISERPYQILSQSFKIALIISIIALLVIGPVLESMRQQM